MSEAGIPTPPTGTGAPVKRYALVQGPAAIVEDEHANMEEHDYGEYVLHSDYAALLARCQSAEGALRKDIPHFLRAARAYEISNVEAYNAIENTIKAHQAKYPKEAERAE